MSNNLTKTVLVTGGTKGIGEAITNKYLSNDYYVVTISRSKFKSISTNHSHFVCDLSNWKDLNLTLDQICNEFKIFDVLINNVGVSSWMPLEHIDDIFLDKMFHTNVYSYFGITKKLLPFFNKSASIINISSMAAKRGTPNNSVYCATKFAISGMTQAWAKELGPKGIRVNSICPVLIDSPGLREAIEKQHAPASEVGYDQFIKNFTTSQVALDSLPQANNVADFCFFLSSHEAEKITGQNINLDSGVFPQ